MITDYERGQWTAAEALLSWLNEQEELLVPKTKVYEWGMNFRPKKDSDE